MKLEKISDNQIRCTLNQNDLMEREIKISELAYGTEKIRSLFNDMMEQASEELGFEAEGTPLVIEAIPLSGECITLIITKVENPEELDTRFSRFTGGMLGESMFGGDDDPSAEADDTEEYVGADEILDFFKTIKKNLFGDADASEDENPDEDIAAHVSPDDILPMPLEETEISDTAQVNITRIFAFNHLDDITSFALALHGEYPAVSKVYKHPSTGSYLLVMEKGLASPESFNRICNIATEYGRREKFTYATLAYYAEHYETIIKKDALMVLAELI